MTDTYNLCIYHARCPDGTAAAWVARLRFPSIELHPASYGDPPPDVLGKRVIVVDFSYPRAILERMAAEANSLLVLDHHLTTEKALAGLPFCVFDQQRSGASMTWDHLFPGQARPWVIRYVEDRDLARNQLPDTETITAYLSTIGYNPSIWTAMLADIGIAPEPPTKAEQIGKGALSARLTIASEIASMSTIGFIDGHQVPVVMAPALWAEVGDMMLDLHPEVPFVATFRPQDPGSFEYRYSLRSRTGGFDVASLAIKLGGGGHMHASGFSAPRLIHLPHTRAQNTQWPWCPRCGENELYSLSGDPKPTDNLTCYRCGWKGIIVATQNAARPLPSNPT